MTWLLEKGGEFTLSQPGATEPPATVTNEQCDTTRLANGPRGFNTHNSVHETVLAVHDLFEVRGLIGS